MKTEKRKKPHDGVLSKGRPLAPQEGAGFALLMWGFVLLTSFLSHVKYSCLAQEEMQLLKLQNLPSCLMVLSGGCIPGVRSCQGMSQPTWIVSLLTCSPG